MMKITYIKSTEKSYLRWEREGILLERNNEKRNDLGGDIYCEEGRLLKDVIEGR